MRRVLSAFIMRNYAKIACVLAPLLLALPLTAIAFFGGLMVSRQLSYAKALSILPNTRHDWISQLILATCPYVAIALATSIAAVFATRRMTLWLSIPATLTTGVMNTWLLWGTWASTNSTASLGFLFTPVIVLPFAACAAFVGVVVGQHPILTGVARQERFDLGLCSKCGYDMLGVTTTTCPECGAKESEDSPN